MELRDAIRSRRMVRATDGTPVDGAVVDELLGLALQAPSAGWSQGQAFVVVRGADERRAIAEAAGEADYVRRGFAPWLSTAPVLVVPCTDQRAYRDRYGADDKSGGPEDWGVPYWWFDLGAAVQNLLLLATEAGWAAGFLGAHGAPGLDDVLELPSGVHPAGIVTLGPAPATVPGTTRSERRGRREEAAVLHHDRWSDPA